MARERTLILIKPDAVQRKLCRHILTYFEQAGFDIVSIKMLHPTREQARRHYLEHADRPFFDDLVAFLTSGPVIAMRFDAEDAIARSRQLIGETQPDKRQPGTIRYDLQSGLMENLVHGSDKAESAEYELALWFGSHMS